MARLCRRICLLRERGLDDDAQRLHSGTLGALISQLRDAAGPDTTVVDQRLQQIMATENERVANAAVLAELLAPLLSDKALAPSAAADAFPPATPAPQPVRPPSHPPFTDIATFIDEMIAHERTSRRGDPQRRAS